MRNDLTIYNTHARSWWDGSQRFLRLLQNIVPARMRHFSQVVEAWTGKVVLDLGCGGGFMAEALARAGADTIGVDPSGPAVDAAREHARLENLNIDYRIGTGERIPLPDEAVDCVVCVDVLEHVDSVDAVLGEITRVLKPGGLFLFDTINRTVVAKIVIVGLGEFVLGLLPRGTHDPAKFITPAELARKLESRGYELGPIVGLAPVGINRRLDFTFGRFPSTHIMYMGHARKARVPHRGAGQCPRHRIRPRNGS
jgi:2-polyprenyl-6-hydroxyphenyl methylase/3-demethylubiquinone-9 3-methyltransferase